MFFCLQHIIFTRHYFFPVTESLCTFTFNFSLKEQNNEMNFYSNIRSFYKMKLLNLFFFFKQISNILLSSLIFLNVFHIIVGKQCVKGGELNMCQLDYQQKTCSYFKSLPASLKEFCVKSI